MKTTPRDRLWVFAAALCFSTGGVAIKGNALTTWQVASFRSLVAGIALALLFPYARRGWSWRHAAVGVVYAFTLITFVIATKLTTAANAIFLQSTAPAYLLVLGPLVLKERLRKTDLWLLLAVATGMSLFFIAAEPARATAPDPVRGNIVAAISGVGWAGVVLGLRWLSRRDDGAHASMTTVVVGNLIAFVAALPWALPVERMGETDVLGLLYLGVVQIGLAYVCLTRAIRRVSAFETSTLLLIEPALNPFWTWLVLHETPSRLAMAGGAIILVSTLVNTWWHSRAETSSRP